MNFTTDDWIPSRLPFGKFKSRCYQEARVDGELRSWLEWLSELRTSGVRRVYLLTEEWLGAEGVAFLDPEIQERVVSDAAGPVVFQQPRMGLYQRLVEAAENWMADLELEFGIEKSKVDVIRSKLFGALQTYYQERDGLRMLVNFRNAFIERLLSGGKWLKSENLRI